MSGIMLAAWYCGLWAGTAAHPSEAHPVSLVMPGPPCSGRQILVLAHS